MRSSREREGGRCEDEKHRGTRIGRGGKEKTKDESRDRDIRLPAEGGDEVLLV